MRNKCAVACTAGLVAQVVLGGRFGWVSFPSQQSQDWPVSGRTCKRSFFSACSKSGQAWRHCKSDIQGDSSLISTEFHFAETSKMKNTEEYD